MFSNPTKTVSNKENALLTLAITHQDLVYFGILIACTYTTWLIGLSTGGQRTVDYLIDEGLLSEETLES
jgi:hypothetical protein